MSCKNPGRGHRGHIGLSTDACILAGWPCHSFPGRECPCVPPHTGTPAEAILKLQLQHRTSLFHQPFKKPGPVLFQLLQLWLSPVPCCSPASPLLWPPSQAASAQLVGSTCRCPLPFSEGQRAVPAWPRFNNESSHRGALWQGCSPLTMPLPARDGMQGAEVLLGRVSDTAVTALWGPQEQGAHLTLGIVTLHTLSWAPCDLPCDTCDLGHPRVTSHQSGSTGR